MTEVERIINEGIISADFLKPEVRYDFLVDSDRKKVWAICLDLLIKFDALCKKHHLKYFIFSGSLLGTIRHKGFIPWDDDMDVAMMREDYERLNQIASEELSVPYFWQTPYTDKGYLYSFNKIRNSNTSGISTAFRFAGFNQGITLDIFPIDNWALEGGEERYNAIKRLNMENSAHMRRSNPHPTKTDLERIAQFPYRDPKKVVDEINAIVTQYKDQECDYVRVAVATILKPPKGIYKKSDFESTMFFDFEGILKVPVPAGYDNILTVDYGDYMTFPPVEDRGKWHDGTIFNADKPYSEYEFD
ncbi:MAG: LicD family protein [Bacteroidales bacterium]